MDRVIYLLITTNALKKEIGYVPLANYFSVKASVYLYLDPIT